MTLGVEKDGKLKHTHDEDAFHLIPLGHFNWKWSSSRAAYSTYEQEVLSGILTLSSQIRILGHLPIVWLCDQEATSSFARGPPPNKPRLKRWWLMLTQFRINIFHIPGAKNELCDFLSRNCFNEKFQVDIEDLARKAFQRMDVQLDLRIENLHWNTQEYLDDEFFVKIWNELTIGKSKLIKEEMYWRSEDRLFREKKLCIPKRKIPEAVLWVHQLYGHPGGDKTFWHFLAHFWTPTAEKELQKMVHDLILPCKVCCEAKPNMQRDRGLVGALPVPNLVNQVVYLDFIQVDDFNGFDYILTIVDGLSRFARFLPCRKTITGEKAFKLFFENWVQVYGKPREVVSDNDVRFTSEKAFWRLALDALDIRVTFVQPRHPQSNGLCERTNRKFLQNARVLMSQQSSKDWLRLVPFITWIHNNQLNPQTGYTPHELFFGRPTWIPESPPEPDSNPSVESWVQEQAELCRIASRRLMAERLRRLRRSNKGRIDATYSVGDFVLIHRKRFPQWAVSKLGTQWFGPYRIVQLKHNTAVVRASPRLGGEVDVGFSFLKKFHGNVTSESEEEEEEPEETPDFATPSRIDHSLPHEPTRSDHSNAFGWPEVLPRAIHGPGGAALSGGLLREQVQPPEQGAGLEYTEAEHHRQGYFFVEAILKHKYKQGYKFLTKWERYPIQDSTWEPVKAFVQPDGAINPIFQRYCQDQGLEKAYRKALQIQTSNQPTH